MSASGQSGEAPNVLFLLSDQHNFRHLSRRDGAPVDTASLDRIADAGVDFRAAYCPVPICTPSRLCMLTGREARRCGAWGNGHRVRPDLPTLPGVLSESGYETCLVGKMHLGGDRQFAGFDHRPYGDLTGAGGHQHEPPTPGANRGDSEITTSDVPGLAADDLGWHGVTGVPEGLLQETNVLRASLSWLREHSHRRDAPWLLCASFSRPHPPHTAPRRHFERYWPDGVTEPPVPRGAGPDHPTVRDGEGPEIDTMRRRAAYFGCVDYVDEVAGELLRTLEAEGLLENTIVVYTSDHGEQAGERGAWGKGEWPEGSVRVPLLVQTPAHRRGDREAATVDTPVGLVDLFPTLCRLCGLAPPDGVDGADLSAAVETGSEPERGPVVCDKPNTGAPTGTPMAPEFRMVRDGRYKYVGFPEYPDLLFDLEADPYELTNLAADPTGEDARALDRLRDFVEGSIDWSAVRAERRRAEERLADHRLGVPGTEASVNAYHMPDGRVVDADSPLYGPDAISETPERVYEDWPDGGPTDSN